MTEYGYRGRQAQCLRDESCDGGLSPGHGSAVVSDETARLVQAEPLQAGAHATNAFFNGNPAPWAYPSTRFYLYKPQLLPEEPRYPTFPARS
jgi:hypothetical protein